jgi:methionine-rich copper-binding protein CopC
LRRAFVMSFSVIVSLLLLFPQYSLAHTKLEHSSPEPDAVVVNELKEIVMEFNTEVESLSSFKLKQEDGNELKSESIRIVEDRMIGTFTEAIPNGRYTVEWKIVGRDGHPIQGEFQFAVAVPVGSSEPTPEPASTFTPSASLAPIGTEKNVIDQSEQAQTRERTGFWIIGLVVALALIVIVFGKRRKK